MTQKTPTGPAMTITLRSDVALAAGLPEVTETSCQVKAKERTKAQGGGSYNVLSIGGGQFGKVAGEARLSLWMKRVDAVADLTATKTDNDDTVSFG